MTLITIHMGKKDGLENYLKKKKIFFLFSHPAGSVSLLGVLESGFIFGRLPDDSGGFTCMHSYIRHYFQMLLAFNKGEIQSPHCALGHT